MRRKRSRERIRAEILICIAEGNEYIQRIHHKVRLSWDRTVRSLNWLRENNYITGSGRMNGDTESIELTAKGIELVNVIRRVKILEFL